MKIAVTLTRVWTYDGDEAASFLDWAVDPDSTPEQMEIDIIAAHEEDSADILDGAEWTVTIEEDAA